ncbi:mdm31p [Saccharomyces arboricola H-6]|uniref:Mdm31p n=1 Tax=Saccharomyces arboricola (strain H-6 / AS 2.3317 / CBS 10644) TaxID=1160507 RepID=J8Q405_SACAR|nr:mdm31p [Saccharomyces arboricola H-6]
MSAFARFFLRRPRQLPVARYVYWARGSFLQRNLGMPPLSASIRAYSNKPEPGKKGSLSDKLKKQPNLKYITERDSLLVQTNNIFTKLKINIRWFLKKSTRPFNSDDISAFISWILVSNIFIFIFWTTTFVSLVLYLINTVFAQEYLASKIGKFITKNDSLSIVFETAIVPDWSSGKISFQKVFVSRRPKISHGFTKGSQQDALQRAKLALSERILVNQQDFDNGNYTQFDLTIDQVDISLNFRKWINGKGILDEVTINGLRGVIDRTHVVWKKNDDPKNYLNVYQPGDFEISKFTMNDVLCTLYQPNGFRPFQISIFNCDLPQLRKHWLFYDILNANNINGTYDNSMFTIHKKFRTDDQHQDPKLLWKQMTRFRVDNLDIDHLNAGIEGPLGWISEGRVNMIGDVLLPDKDAASDSLQLTEILTEIGDRLIKEAKRYTSSFPLVGPRFSRTVDEIDPNDYFIMDFSLRLYNVKAEVPLFTSGLTYINSALIRPIVGYINSHRTYIPIKCRLVKKKSDFEGAWTIYDSYLMRDLSAEAYDAFAHYSADDEKRSLRLRRVGFWSLQLVLQVILMSLGAIA